MPKCINQVKLLGRLGRDPEFRQVGNSQKASFSLATDSNRKDAAGEWQKQTEWHNIVAWAKAADKVSVLNLHKGDWCQIEGKIQSRSYDGRDGQKRYITEIIAFEVSSVADDKEPKPAQPANEQIDDSDIPF